MPQRAMRILLIVVAACAIAVASASRPTRTVVEEVGPAGVVAPTITAMAAAVTTRGNDRTKHRLTAGKVHAVRVARVESRQPAGDVDSRLWWAVRG